MDFGSVSLTDPILPDRHRVSENLDYSPWQLHALVKQHGCPNFMGARIPVKSQLNVPLWKHLLSNYWDQQLLQFLEFGFPIGFNRNCPLYHDGSNHTSALQYPEDIDKYLEEEIQFGAIAGPFSVNPIDNCHMSPMMTRAKTDSKNRRVIIDLSWPRNASVNDGVGKQAYIGFRIPSHIPIPG